MSEKRTIDQIQQEFTSLCNRAGHCQYQIFTLQKDLDMMNSTIRDLNIEAAQLRASEQEQPAAQPAELPSSAPEGDSK